MTNLTGGGKKELRGNHIVTELVFIGLIYFDTIFFTKPLLTYW